MEGEGARREVDRLTREGLAEGHRLASEAREAIRSRYEDWMMVIALAALLVLALLLLVIVLSGMISAGVWPLAASLAVVAALFIPLFLICKRRFAARLAEQDRWMARLSAALALGRDDTASTFDLLVEVSQQVPVWLSIKQKDRFRSHPFLTTALFIFGASTFYISVMAYGHRGDSSFAYLLMMLVPFMALFIATSMVEWSALRRERETILARWEERAERSRQAMEEMLGGL